MKLMTKAQREQMLKNGAARYEDNHDPKPVIKLFDPLGTATWLLTELDPENPDLAFGLCDLGMGFPDLGDVSISELESIKKGAIRIGIERDIHFKANKTLREYTAEAKKNQRIVA